MKTNELLNAVQRLLIDFANDNGINLQDEFGTVEKFKQFVMAFTIKALTDTGLDFAKAFDVVMGDGAYNRLAADVWAKCQ